MVNSSDFVKRLEKLFEYYGLSAAVFADKIEVQRSGISHLLSGRNKPSLDFVLKVVKTFPEVNLYWLLNGRGSFPSSEKDPAPDPVARLKPVSQNSEKIAGQEKSIEKIVIFYTDGTFKSFQEN